MISGVGVIAVTTEEKFQLRAVGPVRLSDGSLRRGAVDDVAFLRVVRSASRCCCWPVSVTVKSAQARGGIRSGVEPAWARATPLVTLPPRVNSTCGCRVPEDFGPPYIRRGARHRLLLNSKRTARGRSTVISISPNQHTLNLLPVLILVTLIHCHPSSDLVRGAESVATRLRSAETPTRGVPLSP